MTEQSRSSTVRHSRVVFVCLGVTLGMLGMSYAAVPLYQLFCQVTGYAGTTQRADDTTGTVLDRRMTVRFDSNVSNELNWEFTPVQREITLHIGEKAQTSYTARNYGSTPSIGTATFNVTPGVAGVWLQTRKTGR